MTLNKERKRGKKPLSNNKTQHELMKERKNSKGFHTEVNLHKFNEITRKPKRLVVELRVA